MDILSNVMLGLEVALKWLRSDLIEHKKAD